MHVAYFWCFALYSSIGDRLFDRILCKISAALGLPRTTLNKKNFSRIRRRCGLSPARSRIFLGGEQYRARCPRFTDDLSRRAVNSRPVERYAPRGSKPPCDSSRPSQAFGFNYRAPPKAFTIYPPIKAGSANVQVLSNLAFFGAAFCAP